MFIYEIVNKVNGKRYIGQTTQNQVFGRWQEHIYRLNTSKHENQHLQNSWLKYGELNFEFNLIEICQSKEDLNVAENKWILYYNTKNRKYGYNFILSGSNSNSQVNRDKLSKARRPNGYPDVVNPDGIIYSILNLREFSRNNQLTQIGLRQVVVTKKYFHYKGWRLATVDTIGIPYNDDNKLLRGQRISSKKLIVKYPNVISPDGTIYTVDNLCQFCLIYGLSKSNMSMLLRGKKIIYKGWTITP